MSTKPLLLSAPEIHCEACKKIILMAFADLTGIENIQIDLLKKQIRCEYDTTQISVSEIIEHLRKETDFETTPIKE